jgi:hypothetical protein
LVGSRVAILLSVKVSGSLFRENQVITRFRVVLAFKYARESRIDSVKGRLRISKMADVSSRTAAQPLAK